jgi:hypothetical protein
MICFMVFLPPRCPEVVFALCARVITVLLSDYHLTPVLAPFIRAEMLQQAFIN